MYWSAADSDALRRHHDGVPHRAVLLELAHHARDRGRLLADGDVDAVEAAVAIVDDGVDRHRGLAGLPVADDELALAAADGHHGVERLEAGLHRLADGLAGDDPGGHLLDRRVRLRLDRPLAVDRLSERVDHPPEQAPTHRHLEDAPGALHRVALGDVGVVAHDHGADRVAFEVQGEPEGVAGELDHLALHHLAQPVNAGDAVGEGHDGALGAGFHPDLKVPDPLSDQIADFGLP